MASRIYIGSRYFNFLGVMGCGGLKGECPVFVQLSKIKIIIQTK